ncbi:MAG TPA: serine hydrolase, partial [Allosphingosinicella sp.]|nr:serine hydrolase [Allosphingosinicella sp.]
MAKLFLMILLPLAFAACSSGEAPQNRADAKESPANPLRQLAEGVQPGTLGAAILDLRTGQMQGVNADQPMPMQSVFKLPLGIFVFHQAAEGALSLNEKITLTPDDLSPLHSPITDRFDQKKEYTIEELVEVTVAQSDNAAADLLMKRVGGPAALTRFFQERGFRDFRVDRYEYELQPQSTGLPPIEPRMTAQEYAGIRGQVPLDRQRAAMRLYLADPRDRMSASTAVRMLADLDAGKLLSPDMTRKMMAILKGTTSG